MADTDVKPPDLASSPDATYPKRWLALAVLLVAAAMDLIGMTIVTMGLPAIEADLHGGHAAMEWTIAGYGLAFAVGLITGGRLGDVYGRRRVFILGVGAFTAASALCGLAPSVPVLVAARVLQGLFAALMIPQVLSTVTVIFPAQERAKAFGLFGATAGLATVAGPLLGGILLEGGGLGWRSIFLVNVPLGVAVSFAGSRLVPESRAETSPRLDIGGVGLSVLAVALLLVPLVEGPQRGWPPAILAMLAASAPAFLALAVHQRRREQRGTSPLVPPSLFRHRTFVAGALAGLTFFSAPPALFFVIAITLQEIGFSPWHTALTFVPLSLASVPAAGAAIVLAPRLGRRLPIGGAGVVIIGIALLLVAVDSADAGLSSAAFLPGLIVAGLGLGLVSPTLIEVVLTRRPVLRRRSRLRGVEHRPAARRRDRHRVDRAGLLRLAPRDTSPTSTATSARSRTHFGSSSPSSCSAHSPCCFSLARHPSTALHRTASPRAPHGASLSHHHERKLN